MKKIAALLLCISLLSAPCLTARAEANTAPGEATIAAVVPDSHSITVKVKGNVVFKLKGKTGTFFKVERLSEPLIELIPAEGEKLVSVKIDGESFTDKFSNGSYKLALVYEDKELIIEVTTEKQSTSESSKPAGTVFGGSTDNPKTGIIGGVSAGSLILLAAFGLIRRKEKDSEEE